MPYVKQSDVYAEWARRAKRVLLNGSPNSGKSTSLRTWPRPIVIQSYPGEKGTTALPQGDGVTSFVWDLPEVTVNWGETIAETKRLTMEILAGKHGPVTTFAGDGFHKLYAAHLHEATGGASARGEDFDPRLYGRAGARVWDYLDMVLRSGVEYVVMTCWDGHEKDDPDEKGSTPSRHIFPELPGQAAKKVMGEFAVVLYATREGTGPAAQYVWLTAPAGKIWGCGSKVPLDIAKRLPPKVPQDWSVLEKYLIQPQTTEATK